MRTEPSLLMGAIAIAFLVTQTAEATSYLPLPMNEMFAKADVVVFAKIMRGTMEEFETPLYEAVVVESIKGLPESARFYFGPYSGNSLGGEYLLFLKKCPTFKMASVKGDGAFFKAGVPDVVYEVMFVGYGSMEVDYTCIVAKCTACVSVPVEMVPVPKNMENTPYADPRRASPRAWVKKVVLLKYLRALSAETNAR